jgi:hypothetical protein
MQILAILGPAAFAATPLGKAIIILVVGGFSVSGLLALLHRHH